MPLTGLSFILWSAVCNPGFITGHSMTYEQVIILVIELQKGQRMWHSLHFVFFCQHFLHLSCRYYFVLKFVSNNVINYWSWNLWNFLMKLINKKRSVSASFLINILCLYQVIIHDNRLSRSFFIINICLSIIKKPTPFMHIFIIRCTFTINFNKLQVNFSRMNFFLNLRTG